jgi:hypothetical protein
MHPKLGVPSQIVTLGRVRSRLSINSLVYGRGQCSQSAVAMGTRWTIYISTSNTLADQICLHLAMQMQENNPINVLQCVYDYLLYFSSAG